MRILIVDDEPSILELLKTFLESADSHEVTTASSGVEALEIIHAAKMDFDCLLLDIQMPEMNGVELCETVRALPDYQRVPILMLTAMSQKTYIDKAFAVGATDYVIKPFDFMELRGRLMSASRIVEEYNNSLVATRSGATAGRRSRGRTEAPSRRAPADRRRRPGRLILGIRELRADAVADPALVRLGLRGADHQFQGNPPGLDPA